MYDKTHYNKKKKLKKKQINIYYVLISQFGVIRQGTSRGKKLGLAFWCYELDPGLPSLTSCVTLGRSFEHSEPQFHQL